MKNADNPITPVTDYIEDCGIDGNQGPDIREITVGGLTKREYACIHCGVPETGDPDLDAIIAKGNKQKAAKEGLSLRHMNAIHSIMPIG